MERMSLPVLASFVSMRYVSSMSDLDPERLRPATDDELIFALGFALQFEGRKRVHQADGLAARIAAERLVRHLRKSRFVVMMKPPAPGHGMEVARVPTPEDDGLHPQRVATGLVQNRTRRASDRR